MVGSPFAAQRLPTHPVSHGANELQVGALWERVQSTRTT